MLRRLLLSLFILSLFLPAFSGCSGELLKAMQDQVTLRDELIQEYGWNGITTSLQNGSALGISFINSPFNKLDRRMQEAKAREIAAFAKKHYRSGEQLSQILVSFVVYEKIWGIIDYTNALDTYLFDIAELGTADVLSALTDEFQTVYTFDPQRAVITFPTQLFSFFGIVGIVVGLILAGGGFWLWRKRRDNVFMIPVLFGLLATCGGTLFLSAGLGVDAVLSRANSDLRTSIAKGNVQVAEGPVRVLFEQPRSGHTKGDIVKIGDKQFEINYFVAKPTFHQTIAYGGPLRKGVYARVHYVGDEITQIEIKKP